jgi:hypothetical protein
MVFTAIGFYGRMQVEKYSLGSLCGAKERKEYEYDSQM